MWMPPYQAESQFQKLTGKKFNFNSQRTLRSEINSTLGISYDSVDFFPTRLLSLRLDNK